MIKIKAMILILAFMTVFINHSFADGETTAENAELHPETISEQVAESTETEDHDEDKVVVSTNPQLNRMLRELYTTTDLSAVTRVREYNNYTGIDALRFFDSNNAMIFQINFFGESDIKTATDGYAVLGKHNVASGETKDYNCYINSCVYSLELMPVIKAYIKEHGKKTEQTEETEDTDNSSKVLSKIKEQPMVFAIIDDDTNTEWSVQKFHDICVENGVVGGYAIEAQHLESNPAIISLLQGYEDEGFGMYYHCYSQKTYWDIANRANTEDQKLSEADFCKGLRLLTAYGFFDAHTVWVVPGGMREIDDNTFVKSLGIKHGFKYIVNADSKGFLSMEYGVRNNRYDIPRFGMYATDPDGENLAYIKKKIDDCVEMNASMMLMTHTGMWDEDDSQEPTDRFAEIVQYALSKGMINLNPLELFEMKYPFWSYYETR